MGNFTFSFNFKITSGNVSDKNQDLIQEMTKDLEGVLVGDKGYQSQKLFKILNELKIHFLTRLRKSIKNTKAIVFEGYHELKRLRQKIETINGQIKYRQGMESSLPRSDKGYLWRYVFAIFNYVLLNQFLSG